LFIFGYLLGFPFFIQIKIFCILKTFLLAFIPVFHRTMITADPAENLAGLSALVGWAGDAYVTGLGLTAQTGINVRHWNSPWVVNSTLSGLRI